MVYEEEENSYNNIKTNNIDPFIFSHFFENCYRQESHEERMEVWECVGLFHQ